MLILIDKIYYHENHLFLAEVIITLTPEANSYNHYVQ
jgi:hypothetical protein